MFVSKNPAKYSTFNKIFFWLILAVGLFLRCYQYFLNRSLWHDEAHLALNFVDLGFKGLTQPLENYQAAPILFLFGVETVSRVAGLGELSLRFFPFILSISVLPLFYFFTLELTKSRITALMAFLLYALNLSLIYYSSELKPYTLDVSVYVALGYFLLSKNAFVTKHRTLILIITGCLAVLLANATPVIMVCAGIYLISQWHISRQADNQANVVVYMPVKHLYIFGSWSLVFILNYMKFIYKHPYAEGMKDMWSFTFCPLPFSNPEFGKFMHDYLPGVIMTDVFDFSTAYAYVAALIMLAGIVYCCYYKKYIMMMFTTFPFVLHLILSMLSLYPFYNRFLLYTAPGIMILMAVGMSALISLSSNAIFRLCAQILVIISLFFATKNNLLQFPRYDIRIKPSLIYIDKFYPNAPILVTTPGSMLEYYQKTGFLKNKQMVKIPWNLDSATYFNDQGVKTQTSNYVILHSMIGGDNSDVFMAGLKARGLVVKEFTDNNFGVTEVRPALSGNVTDSVRN